MSRSVFTDAYNSVVEYLIQLRKDAGVSQVELARRLGRTQQFVSYIETRERRLDVVEFYAYVRALGGDPKAAILELFDSLPDDLSI